MKNKKIIIYTLSGVATVVLGYFIYKKVTAPTLTFGEIEEDDNNNSSTPNPSSNNSGFPLKRGSKGDRVKQLQRFLIAEGYNIGNFGVNKDGVDGDFGRLTEQAVAQNQKPFNAFKSMYPKAVRLQVSKEFFDLNIKGRY